MKQIVLTLCVFMLLPSLADAASILRCVDSKGYVTLTNMLLPQDAICTLLGSNRILTRREIETIVNNTGNAPIAMNVQEKAPDNANVAEVSKMIQDEIDKLRNLPPVNSGIPASRQERINELLALLVNMKTGMHTVGQTPEVKRQLEDLKRKIQREGASMSHMKAQVINQQTELEKIKFDQLWNTKTLSPFGQR